MAESSFQTLGRYTIHAELGRGGFATVYRATDTTLEREVALKILKPGWTDDAKAVERFMREARQASRLKHPNIVTIYDVGQAEGRLFIAMELVRGRSLQQIIAEDGMLPWARVLAILEQSAAALDYAHSQGLVHRDIKPANIILDENKPGSAVHVMLTDFGLVRGAEEASLSMGTTGGLIGTPEYIAPEIWNGEPATKASDIYAMGCVAFYLLTGQVLFSATTPMAVLKRHSEGPVFPQQWPDGVPAGVDAVLLRALAKEPGQRPASAPEFAAELRACEQRGASLQDNSPRAGVRADQDQIQIKDRYGNLRTMTVGAGALLIGRAPESDISLDQPNVSDHHARIDFDGAEFYVTDLDSANGTILAGRRLRPQERTRWTPGEPLRVGQTYLYLQRAASQVERRVDASLEIKALAVDPGHAVTAPLVVVNRSASVDRLDVSIDGLPRSWVPSPPAALELKPGEQRALSLTIQPPRSPQSRAAEYPFTVCVTSQARPAEVAKAPATLTVNPFHQFTSEISPVKVRAGQAARVTVTNQGNLAETFALEWKDQANELVFKPRDARLEVAEGRSAAAEYRAQPVQRRWIGGKKSHAIAATVRSVTGDEQVVSGEVVSRGLIPIWFLPVAFVLLAVIFLVLRGLIVQTPVIRNLAVDPPQPQAGAPVTIRWQIANAQSIDLRPLKFGLDPRQGSYTFEAGFNEPTALSVVVSNQFGSEEKQLLIPVVTPTPLPLPGPDVSVWSVSPVQITRGESITITWKVNADNVTLDPFGSVEPSGQKQDTPQQTRTYSLVVTRNGQSVTKSQEVVVREPPPDAPKVTIFSVQPVEIVKGQNSTVRLTWDTEKADTVTIEPGLGPVGLSGSRDVSVPESDTTYTLVAKGPGGETKRQVQLKVSERLCSVIFGTLNLRNGPGMIYEPPLRELVYGTQLAPLAYNPLGFPEGPWLNVRVKQTGEMGWVSARPQYVNCNFDFTTLAPAEAPPTPTPTPAPVTPTPPLPLACIPSLISPETGAILDNGRTDQLDNEVWDFDWSDCPGATTYQLYVIHTGAINPVLDNSTISGSSYHRVSQSYIADNNRFNWTWKVRASIRGQWGPWSETRTFDVEPVDTDPPTLTPTP